MPSATPKALVGKLNTLCRSTLEAAAGLCLTRTHYQVEIEHWLLKLLEASDSDSVALLRHLDLNVVQVTKDLTRALDNLRSGSPRRPAFAEDLLDWMQSAWLIASLELGATRIRSGALLAAAVLERPLARRLGEVSAEWSRLQAEDLRKALTEVRGPAERDTPEAGEPTQAGAASQPESADSALARFTADLTERARKGELDPVVGRDAEIRQMMDILTRRRQNNPILTGEAGVGKTAVVEGFALRVASGDVPPPLKPVAVRVLDLGLLQAGASVKGEFENRLKNVLSEVKASPQPIILFIDEAHTMIGAGGQAGQGDAANLLKPALARGELRTIAATTWAEYKKYFATDTALKRRFEVVKVEEPDEARAVTMLRGLASRLEAHHRVRLLDEAVEEAVKLSHRYIPERQLPDKAVSLIDTACARVGLSQSATPAAVEDCRREIEALDVTLKSLERETATGADHGLRRGELTERRSAAQARLATLETQLTEERKIVADLQTARTKLEAGDKTMQPVEFTKLNDQLGRIQGERPLVFPVVNGQVVAEVVAAWTGIPVGKMVRNEIDAVGSLRAKLETRVIGQTHALDAIARRVRTARANLADPRRPQGVFLLVGPSGVGKTETALALADVLFGGDRSLITINMSEYQEEHKISRLTGSAPGYVGYGEGGVLTEAVRRKPYSVVLLDEVEKAAEGVQEVFYQVFDKGALQDDKGTIVDFKNTLILLTSNAGSDRLHELCADPDTRPDPEALQTALRPALLKVFKPALLGRMTVVPYYPLSPAEMGRIVQLQLGRITDRVAAGYRAALTYDQAVVDTIVERCHETETGARALDHLITGTLLPELAAALLGRMAEGQAVGRAHIGVAADKKFTYELS